MNRLRQKLTFANAIALVALFAALGGTVYAAAKINGKTIKKESIPGNRLKLGSVGGAQVNEAGLAQVPGAFRATEAAKAAEAARAGFAARAGEADRALKATEAASAAQAVEASAAKSAARAAKAGDAARLGEGNGVPAEQYLSKCAPGTVKASALITTPGTAKPVVVDPFNCNGGGIDGVRNGLGEYTIAVAGQPTGFPIATPRGKSVVSVLPRGLDTYRVIVFDPRTKLRKDGESFTFAVF